MTDTPSDTPSELAQASRRAERGATVIEYIGLGAVSTMLVTGIAAALDSAIGEKLGHVVVQRLLEAIAGG